MSDVPINPLPYILPPIELLNPIPNVRSSEPAGDEATMGRVPNAARAMVCIREIVESELWHSDKLHLPLALGKDVTGKDLIVDLAAMPHLLIAGATGAGKTVCINSILTGLLITRTPEELRLILVDPMIVEFSIYNNLPHLAIPVVTNPKKVALALRWAINEMEKRYKLFAKVGVRNIDGYNTRPVIKQPDSVAPNGEESPITQDAVPAKVPYIVIVIDELADLMLVDQAEIENCIARLAQLSRAIGIHMIIATQRPSVNVITGTIKANFPARISFQVAQKVDSRTILDTQGAETLLSEGDMLYLEPSNSNIIRAQGTMTTDEEITAVVGFIKKQGGPVFINELYEKLENSRGTSGVDDGQVNDELIERAIEVIRETQRVSASTLQRRLRIGYSAASRIIDILEERDIVGPARGADPRDIFIDRGLEDGSDHMEEKGHKQFDRPLFGLSPNKGYRMLGCLLVLAAHKGYVTPEDVRRAVVPPLSPLQLTECLVLLRRSGVRIRKRTP